MLRLRLAMEPMGCLVSATCHMSVPGQSLQVILQSYTNMCDMWSLGVVVFLLLVGYMPFPVLPDIAARLYSGFLRAGPHRRSRL